MDKINNQQKSYSFISSSHLLRSKPNYILSNNNNNSFISLPSSTSSSCVSTPKISLNEFSIETLERTESDNVF